MMRAARISTLFPYTTLFRSRLGGELVPVAGELRWFGADADLRGDIGVLRDDRIGELPASLPAPPGHAQFSGSVRSRSGVALSVGAACGDRRRQIGRASCSE